jgi:hypothetical protein
VPPQVDVYATESHFEQHLLPVYRALKHPGDFQLHNPDRAVVVASFGDMKRAQKAGYTRIARFEHGAGQNYGTGHGSYAGGKGAEAVGLFLTPNEYSANLWRKAYPEARVEVVGCPKLDELPAKDPAHPLTVALSFHWDCHLVPETVSAFQHYRFVLEDLKQAVNLIGHGHPRAFSGPPMLDRRYRRAGITAVRDFADVCRQADLYITDNSSSLYEFAATGRPVVVLNAPWYRRDVHHGLRFWDAIPGPQVDHSRDLVPTVLRALETDTTDIRESALAKVYAYRSGAAERAARIIEEWA